jgi:hypothetical protein
MGGSPGWRRMLINARLRTRLSWIRPRLFVDEPRLAVVPSPAQHRTLRGRRSNDLEGRTLDAAPLEIGSLLVQYSSDHKLDVAGYYHRRV